MNTMNYQRQSDTVATMTIAQQQHDTLIYNNEAVLDNMLQGRRRLGNPTGAMGRAYLAGRGFVQETWEAFEWGFEPQYALPDANGILKAPAILIPWHRNGQLQGVNRLLLEQVAVMQTSARGSKATSILYRRPNEGTRAICIIAKDEFDCASIWQATRWAENWVTACSIKGKASWLSQEELDHLRQSSLIIVWSNKPGIVESLDETINQGLPIERRKRIVALESSEGDANTLLQAGCLHTFLLEKLFESLEPTTILYQWLYWDCWEALHTEELRDDWVLPASDEIVSIIEEIGEKTGINPRCDCNGLLHRAVSENDREFLEICAPDRLNDLPF